VLNVETFDRQAYVVLPLVVLQPTEYINPFGIVTRESFICSTQQLLYLRLTYVVLFKNQQGDRSIVVRTSIQIL
jgi:hypothetical protein